MALSNLKERTGREAILSKYEKLMAEKFVRTEPLGTDRHGRRHWVFEGDSRCVSYYTVAVWFWFWFWFWFCFVWFGSGCILCFLFLSRLSFQLHRLVVLYVLQLHGIYSL